MTNVFDYTDYRAFLKSYYEDKKSHTQYFSFRYFSKKAGFSSPSWLKFVINGERNLAQDSIERFITALELKERAGEYFRALVNFNRPMHLFSGLQGEKTGN